MGFGSLFVVAAMPFLQFMLEGLVGAFLASRYINILTASARRDLNKVVFFVFIPSLVFSSLAKAVNLQELISWWFMPINSGMTFLIGGTLGWVAVKILKPEPYLEGLIIASCSAGNMGNLLIIIVPAICDQDGSPFGEVSTCRANSLSYVSLSMALGAFFIYTYTYSLMRNSGAIYDKICIDRKPPEILDAYSEVSGEAHIIKMKGEVGSNDQEASSQQSTKFIDQVAEHETIIPLLSSSRLSGTSIIFLDRLKTIIHQIVKELLAPPTIAAVSGLIVGVIPWLKSLIIGANAPLRVIQNSIKQLGDGAIPTITLILGGNLLQGLRKSTLKPSIIITIIFVKYLILPIAGLFVIKAAGALGFLPKDPLFQYVLMLQYAVPPAVGIGSMTQLFNVAKEECSVIFLWTYLAAAFALTAWSAFYMWLLS